MGTLQEIGVFVVDTIFSLYIAAIVIRFVLALSRADFYNQFSQVIVKVTNPVLVPLRRLIPSMGKIDTAAIVLALVLIMVKVILILMIKGGELNMFGLLIYAFVELVRTVIWIYIIALVLQAIMSWIGTGHSSPLSPLLNSLTQPVLRPIRNIVPNIGMMDISPMIAIMFMYICLIILNGIAG